MRERDRVKNKARWDWLVTEYQFLEPKLQNEISTRYIRYRGDHDSNDIILHEVMLAVGIVFRLDDPFPPHEVYMTDDGAQQYADIFHAQDIMEKLGGE
jgi:hypothetical protein